MKKVVIFMIVMILGVAPLSLASQTEADIQVDGMDCAMCVKAVDGAVNKLPGIEGIQTNFKSGLSKVTFDSSKVTLKQILGAINKTKFEAVKA